MKNRFKDEVDLLHNYLYSKGLKSTKQRDIILRLFLSTERHITAEELYIDVNKSDHTIGIATIYRALNLFADCGLAQKRQFGDNQTKYEHIYNHKHHDHLICEGCGKIIEFEDPMIERLQKVVAEKHKFLIYSHRLDIYGRCEVCQGSKSAKASKGLMNTL